MTPVEHYLRAAAEWHAAKSEIRRYVMIFRKAVSVLDKRPEEFCFTGLPTSSEVLSLSALSASETFDAEAWPSASTLQEAVLRYVSARDTAREAWADVPADLRFGLASPQ